MSEKIESLFIQASRTKLRFNTIRGQVTVEDLWDMPLSARDNFDLDTVAKILAKSIREVDEESFVKPKVDKTEALKNRLEIVKYVIEVKMAEKKSAEEAETKKAKRENIMRIISEKEANSLKELPIDELKKLLEEV